MKAVVFILSMLTSVAAQAVITPYLSEKSFTDAANSCRADGGEFVGFTMETKTATKHEFYVVPCARNNEGQTAYTIAWSAVNFADADKRCRTSSVSTGLPAGEPVGQALFFQTSKAHVFLTLCQLP